VTDVCQFQKRLEKYLQFPCLLKINENRSTMIHLLERNRKEVRLSIHKMFLDAPENVIAAIAHYLRGTRKNRSLYDQEIKNYIHINLERFDYSHLLNKQELLTQGVFYDLEKIYHDINHQYFNSSLDLHLTWFGKRWAKNRSRIVFGQYLTTLKLVKIHRMLDDPFFPEFFVSFILYHEMLHAHVPATLDERGKCHIHGRAFKEQEKKFRYYREAIAWERANKDKFFK